MKNTKDLENELNNIHSEEGVIRFIRKELGTEDFGSYLQKLLDAKKMTIDGLEIQTTFFGRVSKPMIYASMNGGRTPSKDTVIRLGLGMRASVDELNTLLKLAGHKELYAKRKIDALLIYGINQKMTPEELLNLLSKHNVKGYKLFETKDED